MDTGHFPSESDLLSLIQHVYETDANNESYALEWKSALVFKGDGLLPIVTNILGFANRDPSKAGRFYDGYGHFVVGVEPGSVYGIDDPWILPISPTRLVLRRRRRAVVETNLVDLSRYRSFDSGHHGGTPTRW